MSSQFNNEDYQSFLNKTIVAGAASGTDSQPRQVTYYSSPALTITAISQAADGIVTSVGHGLVDGQQVFITGSDSDASVDGLQTVVKIDDDTFTVGVNTSTTAGTTGSIYNELHVVKDMVIDSYSGNGDPTWHGQLLINQRLNIAEGKFEFIQVESSDVAAVTEKFDMIGYSDKVSSSSAFSFLNPVETSFDWSVGATTVDIVSSDAADAAAGTGAATVHIYGLDGSFVEQSEELTLTGTTPVTPSANTYSRINKVQIGDLGSSNAEDGSSNSGVITVTRTTSGEHLSTIPINEGAAQLGHVTVPAGKTWCLSSINLYGERNREFEVRVMVRENLSGVGTAGPKGPYVVHKAIFRETAVYVTGTVTEMKIPEQSDVFIVARQRSGAGNGEVSVHLMGTMMTN